MNSIERHEARYQRRKAKRLEKRKRVAAMYSNYENIFSFDALYNAYKLCKQGTTWKSSVQTYGYTLSAKLAKLVDICSSPDNFKFKGFFEFDINERGKIRHIKSVDIEERVVQRSFDDNCLIPILRRYLIYDNGATLKGKGPHFQMKRLCIHLHNHYKKYGLNGFIYLFDFHDYFGSIPINMLIEKEREKIIIETMCKWLERFILPFGEKGLGLGSQTSQISAVFYPNPIDHYIKDQMGIEGYDRYMDDGFIICHSKKYLKKCIAGIKELSDKLGLKLNEKKCRIQKISKQFTFLKTRIRLTKDGKIIKKIVRKTVTRERRKLRKYRKLYDTGQMTFERIHMSFKSWVGSMKKRGILRKSLCKLYDLFNELFIEPFKNGKDYYDKPKLIYRLKINASVPSIPW